MAQFILSGALFLLAVIAGASFVLQSTVNTHLKTDLGSPLWAGFVSYLGGTIIMAVLLIASGAAWPRRDAFEASSLLWWTGGFFGAIYVGALIYLFPRLGAGTSIALFIAGQMVAAACFDHFGILGTKLHPMDLQRLIGILLLIGGVVLVRK